MHLPRVFAFAPALFFGVATFSLAASASAIARKPVPEGAQRRRALETALLMTTFLASLLCLLCVALGFAYINAQGIFIVIRRPRRPRLMAL